MKNLKTLSLEELATVNGGCQIGDCWPYPIKFPFPIGPPPTFPDDTLIF